MTAQCKGQTSFMNVVQRCTSNAYDDEGYCTVHALLVARQRVSALQARIEALEKAAKDVVGAMRGSGGINPKAAEALLKLAALLEGSD